MARAAETSAGATYETEIPSVTSEPNSGGSGKSATHHKAPNTQKSETGRATGSDAETGGGSESSGEGSGSKGHKKEGSSSSEEEGNPATAGGGGGGGNPPKGGAGGQPQGSVGEGQEVAPATSPGANVSKSSGGGSSPVVPILIAVVVLAAISIGVVLYRQRKSGQGGSDGRVSSSNAS
jgi:two-component system, chemotaxis family, sensor kinase CheA